MKIEPFELFIIQSSRLKYWPIAHKQDEILRGKLAFFNRPLANNKKYFLDKNKQFKKRLRFREQKWYRFLILNGWKAVQRMIEAAESAFICTLFYKTRIIANNQSLLTIFWYCR